MTSINEAGQTKDTGLWPPASLHGTCCPPPTWQPFPSPPSEVCRSFPVCARIQRKHSSVTQLFCCSALATGTNPPDITVTLVAGLLDLAEGVKLDFDAEQIAAFQVNGFCYKQFFLPSDCGPGAGMPWWEFNVALAEDGAAKDGVDAGQEGRQDPPADPAAGAEAGVSGGGGGVTVMWRLNRPYYDSYFELSIPEAMARYQGPLLVVHADADRNVPFTNGQALFEAAQQPKEFVCIKGGNHLLSSTKHFKKFAQAFKAFVKV